MILLPTILFFSSVANIPSEKEIQCLATAIYYEAGGEGIEGKKAVANVLINRTHSNKFPKSFCEVIAQPHQFTWYLRKKTPQNKYIDIAEEAVADQNDNTKGALFFRSIHSKVKWKYRTTIRIGHHIFAK